MIITAHNLTYHMCVALTSTIRFIYFHLKIVVCNSPLSLPDLLFRMLLQWCKLRLLRTNIKPSSPGQAHSARTNVRNLQMQIKIYKYG